MKTSYYLLFLLLFLYNSITAQKRFDFGKEFEIDFKNEANLDFVLCDNYNTYLLSTVTTTGITAENKIIIRKIDQKNTLVETIEEELPNKSQFNIHTIIGIVKMDKDKIGVITENLLTKEKTSNISIQVFDKSTKKFTTSILRSYTYESVYKRPDLQFNISNNNQYFVLNYKLKTSKKEPEKNTVFTYATNNLNLIWQKETEYTNGYNTNYACITDDNKVVLFRKAISYKEPDYLVYIDQNNIDDKPLPETIEVVDKITPIRIGEQNYIIGFNHKAKGIRSGDYNNLFLYDLELGKIINNPKLDITESIKLKSLNLVKTYYYPQEIHLIYESKVESGTKSVPDGFGKLINEPRYTFGPSYFVVLANDGSIKTTMKIPCDETAEADFFHSFGIDKIENDYYINSGVKQGFYKLDSKNNYSVVNIFNFYNVYINDFSRYEYTNFRLINQFFSYQIDTNKIVIAYKTGSNKMAVGSFNNIK